MITKKQIALVITLVMFVNLFSGTQLIYATPIITGVNGTSVDYDEMAGDPVLAMPGLSISGADFDSDSYIDFEITDATEYDQLDLQEVTTMTAISTVDGDISTYEGVIYMGDGSGGYDAIANIDSVYDGQDGEKLRIIFQRSLPNANFLEGDPGETFDDDDLTGWTISSGAFDLTDNGFNLRSNGAEYTDYGVGVREYSDGTTGSAITITGIDANASAYIYLTDKDYEDGTYYDDGSDNHGVAWKYESVERTSSLTTTVQIVDDEGGTGGRALQLYCDGSVISNNTGTGDPLGGGAYGTVDHDNDGDTAEITIYKYGSAFGPVVVSDTFNATAGENLSIDWKAIHDDDDYEVYGYIIETMGDSNPANDVNHLIFYGRGYEEQEWITSTGTIPNDGEYKFMFINGTYDQTGGFAVGSYLYIDNIKVYGTSYSPVVASDISVLVTYQSTSKDPEASKTLSVTVVDEDGYDSRSTDSSTINIINQFNHAPEFTATGENPYYTNDINQDGDLFSSTSATAVEAADSFETLGFTVTGLLDGTDEKITVAGDDIVLTNGNTGTTTIAALGYEIDVVGDAATVTLSGLSMNDVDMETLVDTLAYKNTATTATSGERVVTLTYVQDSGTPYSGGNDDNDTDLSIASTVNVSNVIEDFVAGDRTTSTADVTWTAPVGATNLQVEYSTNGGATWNNASHGVLVTNATGASITGLSGTQAYQLRLSVTGGDNHGISNIDSLAAMSNTTLITSAVYTVSSGESASETITDMSEGISKAAVLANLTKGDDDQVWNDASMNDPVISGDTLIVTAPDGSSQTTYTFTASGYRFAYDGNGKTRGSVPTEAAFYSEGDTITVLGNTGNLDKGSYNFYVWNTEANGTGTTYRAGDTITMPAMELTLYVKWRREDDDDDDDDDEPETGSIVIVNGEPVEAGEEDLEEGEDGSTTANLNLNNEILESEMERILGEKEDDDDSQNTIEVEISTEADGYKAVLTGDIVKKMEDDEFELEVQTDAVDYIIPAEEIGIDNVAGILGVDPDSLEEIEVDIVINDIDEDKSAEIIAQADVQGYEIMFPPVEFSVVARTTNSSGEEEETEIEAFNNYVERVIEIPEGVSSGAITTGIVYNSDGTFSHIPTVVFEVDGVYYARLSSLTNSEYSIILNPITVESVENHWSKNTVNDMASRLIVKNPETFDPEENITRGDFIEYITKALGIYRTGVAVEGQFTDVEATDELADAITIGVEYGIILGYTDGSFRSDQTITRQEAMVMYSRAMDITNLEGTDMDRYNDFSDFDEVSSWAVNGVKDVLSAGVFNGTSATNLSPKELFSYAEAAQAIKNLLIESELISD